MPCLEVLLISMPSQWLISWVGIGFCALVSFSVSGYSIAVASVQETYGCSKEVALLGITLFTVTFGVRLVSLPSAATGSLLMDISAGRATTAGTAVRSVRPVVHLLHLGGRLFPVLPAASSRPLDGSRPRVPIHLWDCGIDGGLASRRNAGRCLARRRSRHADGTILLRCLWLCAAFPFSSSKS